MESTWTLNTQDGTTIYGLFNCNLPDASDAIFIVHGLACSMYDYTLKRAADFFAQNYDVYRINLYDDRPGARKLIDCTLETHASDLNFITSVLAKKYK